MISIMKITKGHHSVMHSDEALYLFQIRKYV